MVSGALELVDRRSRGVRALLRRTVLGTLAPTQEDGDGATEKN